MGNNDRHGSAGQLQQLEEGGEAVGSQSRARSPEMQNMPMQIIHTIEQLATLEATLWSILEGMKSNVTYVAFFCREYWGTSASKAQLGLEKFQWSDRLLLQVQQACVLESLSLAVASHFCSGTMQGVSVTVRSRLRNLLYYIHENCLVLLDLLRQRWNYESQTHWTDLEKSGPSIDNLNFDILVRVNRYRQLRKGEHVMALRQHNEMIANVVRQLCRGAGAKQLVPRGRGVGSTGHQSPGAGGGRGGARGSGMAAPAGVLSAVSDLLTSNTPLDRMRPRIVRQNMLQYMRFLPLLNVNGADADSPWPSQDPYERFGADKFPSEGPIIWFEPLPPMMADLEKVPKLPPNPDPGAYTLVLDLDETLVHYFEMNGVGNYGIRPGMFEFLQKMNSIGYELVIFTAATQDYADWVIDQIDPDRFIHHRLYRQHALPWGPLFAKDLSRLGRDLDRTLIIDNVQENFMMQPNNGIFIATWYEDPQDTALFELMPMLEELIVSRVRVPDILNKYRDQIPSWAGFGRWDDCGFDGPQGVEPLQPQPQMTQPDPPVQPMRGGPSPAPNQLQQMQQQVPEPQPARVMGTGPSPSYTHMGGLHQQTAAAGTMPASAAGNANAGYPDQQAWSQQASVAKPAPQVQQGQPRPMTAYSGIAGPYQATQSVPQRAAPAFSGIAGPYQAARSMGAGHV
jgi:Dullard-like phosphatase family protein